MHKRRVALITGSTAGIGLAIAEALCRDGCDVMLHGLEDESAMDSLCTTLATRYGVRVAYVKGDLACEDGIQMVVGRVKTLGNLAILVNNAVVRHFAPIEAFPLPEWQRALAVNLSAPFRLVQHFLPVMREAGWGRIINMTSVYGARGTPCRVDYVTTKTGLVGFTRAVAAETVGENITCNAVCPGSVLTPSIEARVVALGDQQGLSRPEAERKFLQGKQPSGRFIESEDVGALVVFLCGDAARHITGAMFPIEGGWLAL